MAQSGRSIRGGAIGVRPGHMVRKALQTKEKTCAKTWRRESGRCVANIYIILFYFQRPSHSFSFVLHNSWVGDEEKAKVTWILP